MKNYTPEEINRHYAARHQLRTGLFEGKPYANYGYWTNEKLGIEQACDAMTELMVESLELEPSDRVLECGCGYGASALYLARHHPPAKYVGLDATEVRVEAGNELLRENGLAGTFEVQLGDATKMPFEDESFDKLFAIECAFHFNTRADFFREAFRVLAPGGVLAMTDIVLSPDLDVADYSNDQLRNFLDADSKHISDANIYQTDRYEQILREARFDLVEVVSIKEQTIPQFARYLELVAQQSPPDYRQRRLEVARHFRNEFMQGGDYVKVRAKKPERPASVSSLTKHGTNN